jgi:hypothetical protein
MVPPHVKTFCLAGLLLLTAGCRVHTLEDAPYTFTLGEVLRDDCGLATTGGVVPGGTLRTEGNQVSLALRSPDLRLVGMYLDSDERFTMDGSLSNYTTVLRGQECLLDTVAFHLDATDTSATTFDGTMSINYAARAADRCVCQFWFKFSATR